jgi:hypothetical protein
MQFPEAALRCMRPRKAAGLQLKAPGLCPSGGARRVLHTAADHVNPQRMDFARTDQC